MRLHVGYFPAIRRQRPYKIGGPADVEEAWSMHNCSAALLGLADRLGQAACSRRHRDPKRAYGGRIMTVEEARRLLQTDEVARYVLSLPIIARLAYTWRDGSPRVVPMWFHWTGEELLMGRHRTRPK